MANILQMAFQMHFLEENEDFTEDCSQGSN